MDLPMTINPMRTERMCHSVEITAHHLNMLEILVSSSVKAVDGATPIRIPASTTLVLMPQLAHQQT